MIVGLVIILLLVLLLPFTKYVEHQLELFLFVMGILALLVSRVFSMDLLIVALTQPIKITLAVLFAGLLFKWLQGPIEKGVLYVSEAIPYRVFIGLFVISLGFISSIITAMIAAIILVVVVTVLQMDKASEIRLVVLACYAIGLGAALTPIGEPLSTIVIGKLDEDFFYLLQLIGIYIVPGIIAFGFIAAFSIKQPKRQLMKFTKRHTPVESYRDIIIRTFKIYLFIMALTFLGAGFQPFIEMYLLDLHPLMLYWINMVSAVLDNATLAAAEVSAAMSEVAIRHILLGLLISGGMLIPGNIPNIIAAGKLKITSLDYAKQAFPIGLLAMHIYFFVLLIFS